ncbi:MAG: hypothetical protein ACHQ17_02795 [Polyangia bacterium]
MKLSLIVLLFALAPLVSGCGDDESPKTHDMSGGAADLGVDLAVGQALSGTRLLSGTLTLKSVTSDDYAIVTDGTGLLEAVPLAGGAAIPIDSASSSSLVIDNLVFSWSNLAVGSGAGTLVVWSAAGGVKTLAQSSYPSLVAASSDDSHVLYSDGTSADGTTTNFSIAGADGTGAMQVLSQKLSDQPCAPILSSAGSRFFVSACDPPGDGGVTSAGVVAIDQATGAVQSIATNVRNYFNTDQAGTRVLTIDLANKATVTLLAGGAPAMLTDAVNQALFINSGATVLYDTPAQALDRIDVGGASPTLLQSANVAGIDYLSYDEKLTIFHHTVDDNTSLSDLYLASLTGPSTPIVLDDQPTAILYGDPFTDDGTQALYYTDLDASLDTGTLNALPVTGGTARAITTTAWLSYAATGGKVIYNDNWVSITVGMTNTGRADLRMIDLSQATSTPVLIATQADELFSLSAERDKVVYTFSEAADKAGLYVAPVP